MWLNSQKSLNREYLCSRFTGFVPLRAHKVSAGNFSVLIRWSNTFFIMDWLIYFFVLAFEWSANNDFIASVSLDATIKLWNSSNFTCLRTLKEPNGCQILCCIFQPSNNNLILIGNNRGEIRVVNVSTGIFLKNSCKLGGCILSITSDANGKIVWAGLLSVWLQS